MNTEETEYECDLCEDTGEIGCMEDDGEGHSFSSSRECPHIAEAKEDRAADDYWKEKDTI